MADPDKVDKVMDLVERYVAARLMANASVPTRAGQDNPIIARWHEQDEQEVRRAYKALHDAVTTLGQEVTDAPA